MSISAIIFNQKIVPSNKPCIAYNDRGFTLGHGLFETILVKKKSIPALDYHWKRLQASASTLGLAIPFSYDALESMIFELIQYNSLQDTIAGARVTISHGESARGLLPALVPQPNVVISVFEHSIMTKAEYSAVVVDMRKNEYAVSSRIKCTSYIDNIFAKQEAVRRGFDEAILLNTSLFIADGAIANVYMVKNNQIFTPRVSDGALPGVVRAMLLDEFNKDFSMIEKSLSLPELLDADEVFLTNALMGVRPVSRLNDREFDSFVMANDVGSALRERKNYI